MDAAAAAMGLSLAPGQRAGVLRFLVVAEGMAATLEAARLPDDALEIAPVYTPPTDP